MNISSLDAGIPILTEIIPAPYLGEAQELDREAPPAPTINAKDIAPDVPPAFDDDKEKWHRLEEAVSERVLQQMLERVDAIVQRRIQDGLADVLRSATERLSAEIRNDLREAIQETVPRIVSQEKQNTRID